ncbi:MAG: hypothetical protein H7329_13360, partial [Opitutaceae bacterium]|nr:hypothetical protein [Cytophagales bacterium]
MKTCLYFLLFLASISANRAIAQTQSNIISQPVSDTICQDLTATFTVGVLTKGTTFQWQQRVPTSKVFTSLLNDNGFSGVNTSSLLVNTKINRSASADYRVITKDLAGISDTSKIVFLKVVAYPGTLTNFIGDTVCSNEQFAYINISVTVKDFSYTAIYTLAQGNSITSNATGTGSTLTIPLSVKQLGVGKKSVLLKVSNFGCETQQSDTAKILVVDVPTNTTFTGSTICEGTDSAAIILTGTGFGARYRAFINGNAVSKFVTGTGKIDNLFIQTGKLSPSSYIVKVEASNTGCTIMLSDTAVVNILPAPIGSATSSVPICQNGIVNLGVSQIIKGYTYLWQGPNKFTSTSPNPSFNAKTIGKETYYLEITGNNKCKKLDSLLLVINQVPVLNSILGPNTVCQGGSYDYATDAIKGVTYNWYFKKTQNTLKSISSSVKYLFPDNAVSDTLVVSASLNGCNSVSKQLPIIVNSTPRTIGSFDSLKVCSGDSLTLTSKFKGAVYNWTFAQKTISTSQSVKVGPPLGPGKYKYIVSLSIGNCIGDNDTTEVTVLPKPNASFTYPNNSYCEGMPDAS